ncbi:transcriptional regulator [Streptomyces sp. V4I8]|uniref:FMN-binding negative transcriptional regulator n=1 Tax=Streptomyces sp. V4I8 TaxID=3156469 RepID=UPI0035165D00
MFVPSQYRSPDSSWMVELIRKNPLALMASNGGTAATPFATHLPVIPDPEMDGEWTADLSGSRLWGHMNRENPHWAALETGSSVLLTFTGPHAYVSPTVYEKTPAAPTWNFTAVHVRGVVEKISSLDDTLGVVQATARAFEAEFGADWDMTASLEYFRRIVPGVGAFRVSVVEADGMFKLSQEQKPEVRDRVREAFSGCASLRHRETAELMRRLP